MKVLYPRLFEPVLGVNRRILFQGQVVPPQDRMDIDLTAVRDERAIAESLLAGPAACFIKSAIPRS